ncbi:MAG TPA: ParB/RepB/Spo0J family partition protein [Sphingobium sp.]|uniref:ParB/RepB/Spo0J family partition protein n=1 Tax=Sphingobium sp. TaxID=1912891 RepID=UPI002ED34E2D
MARKQSDYLNSLLSDDMETTADAPEETTPSPVAPNRTERARGTTLLGRESALARVASGEVRQVTQLLLDPARIRIWAGNARLYAHLNEENCRELIDSIISEGGQKVPAVIRRVEDDPEHDYEVIAGTRRHWSVSWLRRNNYPEMQFVAQVAHLDDEAAFRLADLENRARKDVSDLERARNYAEALKSHYDSHLTRMADRLKLSKGWLSKMIKVAGIPDSVIAAFASPADVQLKPAYALAQAMDNRDAAKAITAVARRIAAEQKALREDDTPPLPAPDVLKRLLDAPTAHVEKPEPYSAASRHGRTMLSIQSANRQGITLRLHAGSGANEEDLLQAVRSALRFLDDNGKGLKP